MSLASALKAQGLTRGPVYATGIMKGYEAARMIADFKAQETIKSMTDRVLQENGCELDRVEKLGVYFEHHNVGSRYGITFQDFVDRVDRGTWDPYLA
ncbi:hypothetical protein JJQ72_06425 [Paenibacillus sp. F411]|uniref:Uncharacterized protein n=1 Tax=Paenibacillus algicola TaxID=2565926 RepID=A0A4P8XQ11_9BACL|nr:MULTISPECIES: hypothetical protein [Paenibacillus]MBO2943613.1 hypothetical protein [Paenibacillus sp. F411]QCT03781.1 hypothetical protein E6C60_3070 [Paenibacillus algicola]